MGKFASSTTMVDRPGLSLMAANASRYRFTEVVSVTST